MAEIPVEKKSSFAWLWWLLLLAGVAALLFAIFDNDDDTPDVLTDGDDVELSSDAAVVDDENLNVEVPVESSAAVAITSIAGLATLDDSIGSTVNLETVEVNRVIGDMAFTIGTGANETLVRFNEVQTPETAREGLIDVNPGSVVSLEGNVQELSVSDLPQSVRSDLNNERAAYIFAERVKVQGGGVNPRD